jgi:hypothetical protein
LLLTLVFIPSGSVKTCYRLVSDVCSSMLESTNIELRRLEDDKADPF